MWVFLKHPLVKSNLEQEVKYWQQNLLKRWWTSVKVRTSVSEQRLTCLPIIDSIACSFKCLSNSKGLSQQGFCSKSHGITACSMNHRAPAFLRWPSWIFISCVLRICDLALLLLLYLSLLQGLVLLQWASLLCWKCQWLQIPAVPAKLQTCWCDLAWLAFLNKKNH